MGFGYERKTIQCPTKVLARRGFLVVRQAHDLLNLITVTGPYYYMPLLRALIASAQFASVERPYFFDRVQTVSMLPRHEVSFTVLRIRGGCIYCAFALSAKGYLHPDCRDLLSSGAPL